MVSVNGIVELENAQSQIQNYNQTEEPLLVNPEIDLITDSTFEFEKDGFMKSKNERFALTIKELDLNRCELKQQRKNLFDDLELKIADIKVDSQVKDVELEKKKIFLDLFKESCNIKNDYLALRKYLVNHYKERINE